MARRETEGKQRNASDVLTSNGSVDVARAEEEDAHLAVDSSFARHRSDAFARVGVVRRHRAGLGERAVVHLLVRRFGIPRRSSRNVRRGVHVQSAGDVPAVVRQRVTPLALPRARRRRGNRAVHAPPLRQARRRAGGTRLLRMVHRAPRGGTSGERHPRGGTRRLETACGSVVRFSRRRRFRSTRDRSDPADKRAFPDRDAFFTDGSFESLFPANDCFRAFRDRDSARRDGLRRRTRRGERGSRDGRARRTGERGSATIPYETDRTHNTSPYEGVLVAKSSVKSGPKSSRAVAPTRSKKRRGVVRRSSFVVHRGARAPRARFQ